MTIAEMISEQQRLARRAAELQQISIKEFRDLDADEIQEFKECFSRIKELASEMTNRSCVASR